MAHFWRGSYLRTRNNGVAVAIILQLVVGDLLSSDAYIYSETELFTFKRNNLQMSEGPMFATHQGPFGSGESFMKAEGTVIRGHQGNNSQANLVLNVVFMNETTRPLVGVDVGKDDKLLLCCRKEHLGQDYCKRGIGSVPTVASGVVQKQYGLSKDDKTRIKAKHEVHTSGKQFMMLVFCDNDPTAEKWDVKTQWSFHFKNPYGYIPGLKYAILPFSGAMMVAYTAFIMVFGALMFMRRDHLWGLQYCVLGAGVLGMLEYTSQFFMYLSKNNSGKPLCCPLTGDAQATIAFHVLKITGSALLLIVLSLGFGVVHPKLNKRTTAGVVLLGFALAAIGIRAEIDNASQYSPSHTLWGLLEALLHIVTIIVIFSGLQSTKTYLQEKGESVKLAMYNKLTTILLVLVLIGVVVSLTWSMIVLGWIPLKWKAIWLIFVTFDVLFLVGLLAIAAIWAPNERTYRYALYSQGIGQDETDEPYEESGIQMTELQDSETHQNFTIESDEEEEDEDTDRRRLVSNQDEEVTVNLSSLRASEVEEENQK